VIELEMANRMIIDLARTGRFDLLRQDQYLFARDWSVPKTYAGLKWGK